MKQNLIKDDQEKKLKPNINEKRNTHPNLFIPHLVILQGFFKLWSWGEAWGLTNPHPEDNSTFQN